MARKDVFISGTSGDLSSYREVAKQALLDIGAHPIEQKNFPTTHQELQGMLADLLDPCDAVLHIAGFRYGAEPEHRPGQSRRSYTQWEYYRALQAHPKKPIYAFLAREDCQLDSSEPENEEKQHLQREHRKKLQETGCIYYEFSGKDELRNLIHRCDELRTLVGARLARLPFLPLGKEFTGRHDILKLLEQELGGNTSVLSQPRVIYADGGIGKTALSIEVAWRLYEAGRFNFVLFLNASAPELLYSELVSLCGERVFSLPEREVREEAIRHEAILGWLAIPNNAKKTLLILDSVDSDEAREAVRELLPKIPHCTVLITSRHSGWGKFQSYELDLFTPEEAYDYMVTRLDPGLLSQSNTEATLNSIALEIDHLPLALELVVAYLNENRQTPEEWLSEWQQTPAATIEYHDPDSINYPVSLKRVWDKTIASLSLKAQGFLLGLFSLLAPRPATFPIGWLRKLDHWPENRSALAELAKASLISWPAGRDEVSIHRVLQAILLHRMSEQEKGQALNACLLYLKAGLPAHVYDEAGWRLWERFEPHIRVTLDHLRASRFKFEGNARNLINQYGYWLYNQARYNEAEELFRWALERAKAIDGSENPKIASELSNLGMALLSQNRIGDAEKICRQTIAILEKSSGKEEVLVNTLNTLSIILQSTNRIIEAESILRRALSLSEKSLGPEDMYTINAKQNLAIILAKTERHAEAKLLLEEILSCWEEQLGPMHPNVAGCLNEIAELARAANNFEEAEQLHRRALHILEETYGEEHPNTASSLNNLALTLTVLDKTDEAQQLFARAIAIDVKTFGQEHPKIANRLNNLAWLLHRNNLLAGAEPLYRQSLEILIRFELRNGNPHSSWKTTYNKFEELLLEMGETPEAVKKRYAEIVEEAKKELGSTRKQGLELRFFFKNQDQQK